MPSKRKFPRAGCVDVWNAFMVKGAVFCGLEEIPYCPTTLTTIPGRLVPYDQTKNVSDPRALVHFYLDDQKFDGSQGIWQCPKGKLERLKKFGGVITPDFSTYQDMPRAIKVYSTYKMRAFGYWLASQGVPVVNNVRWGDPDTYDYSFAGLPQNSILALGSYGCVKLKKNQLRFQQGLEALVDQLTPHTLIVYGSTSLPVFQRLRERGITIVEFPSSTSKYFAEQGENNE